MYIKEEDMKETGNFVKEVEYLIEDIVQEYKNIRGAIIVKSIIEDIARDLDIKPTRLILMMNKHKSKYTYNNHIYAVVGGALVRKQNFSRIRLMVEKKLKKKLNYIFINK